MESSSRGISCAASASRFGEAQDYTVAACFNPSKKWVLNGKNDVVEMIDVYPSRHSLEQQHHHHQQQQQHRQQQQQQHRQQQQQPQLGYLTESRVALTRYNSAPSSLLCDLDQIARSLNDTPSLPPPAPPPPPPPLPPPAIFTNELPPLPLPNSNNNSSNRMIPLDHSHTLGLGKSNLIRQSSSPASLLARLEIEAGGAAGGSSEEDSPMLVSPNEDGGVYSAAAMDCGFWPEHNGSLFLNSTSGAVRKRLRDLDIDIADLDNTNVSVTTCTSASPTAHHGLTRHLSLPSSSSDHSSSLLSDSVPCRLRAKRGCATHPRSIAERVRRTRISERMRKLQELMPNMDKQQTNISDMLDEAVEYMKFLQRKVEELSDCREKCQGLCNNKNAKLL